MVTPLPTWPAMDHAVPLVWRRLAVPCDACHRPQAWWVYSPSERSGQRRWHFGKRCRRCKRLAVRRWRARKALAA